MPEQRAKSVVLFIVEGTTEETALGGIFAKLFQNDRVKLDVVHGDITTKANDVDPRETVRKFVINELQRDRGYRWTDISRIVQICDTDGAFIPEDAVVEGSQDGRLVYEESRIVTDNVRGIRARNRRKSAAMWKLSTAGHLTYKRHEVPFDVFYFSRNMEHALHGEDGDLTDRQKVVLANLFRRRYIDNLEGLKEYLSEPVIAIAGTYVETWAHLREGTVSLQRGSNLHLLFRG